MSDQFHPEAEAEHLETVAYYETQQPGLGASYLAAFEAAFERVCEAPRPTPSSGNRIFAVSACHVFPSPYFFANPKGRCKSLPWRLIAVGRRMGSAGSNKGSERTAHSARFWVVRGFFPCGPQLKPGVRRFIMHSVLLAIEKPQISSPVELHGWQGFLAQCQTLSHSSEAAERIGEEVWLITTSYGLSILAGLIRAADERGLRYRALFFDGASTWRGSWQPSIKTS